MSYLKLRSAKESMKFLEQLAKAIRKLGGPLTNQLYCLLRDHRYLELIDFNIDYTWSFSVDDFLYARQIQALVAKQDFLDLGVDKEAVAFKKFLESEEKCRETNIRFNTQSLSSDVNSILYAASIKICDILGECPSIDSLDLSFGPGATTSTKSLVACPRTKLSSRLECSMNLVPRLGQLLEELPCLCDIHDAEPVPVLERVLNLLFEDTDCDHYGSWTVPVSIVPGKMSFVPKNSRTHRSIVVEPVLNGLLQKGIGSYMKTRLLKAGLDLSSQLVNQKAARQGSIDGTLATVDLSSASDCISRELVWSLLPYDWACLLDEARSATVVYKNETILLEKFSSMGNAYTFELESLIFYSLAKSVCQFLKIDSRDVTSYGDDIIIPTRAYEMLVKVLEYCGFSVNQKKSYAEGPFRESCGADYLVGLDIRPYYLKTLINDRVLYSMHNWFFRQGDFQIASLIHSFTCQPLRIYGPDGYGDGHLLGDYELKSSRSMKRKGFCGGTFDTYTLKPISFVMKQKGDYVFPTYSIYVRGEPDLFDPCIPSDPNRVRGTKGYKKVSIYTFASSIFSRYPAC